MNLPRIRDIPRPGKDCVVRFLDASTVHVDRATLEDDQDLFRVEEHEYGWVLIIYTERQAEDYANAPAWMARFHRYCELHDLNGVWFDADANQLTGFQTFTEEEA